MHAAAARGQPFSRNRAQQQSVGATGAPRTALRLCSLGVTAQSSIRLLFCAAHPRERAVASSSLWPASSVVLAPALLLCALRHSHKVLVGLLVLRLCLLGPTMWLRFYA